MKYFLPVIYGLLLVNVVVAQELDPYNYSIQKTFKGRNGAVVSAHPLASKVGVMILKKGGNAIDAAIAANAALGLMEPTGNGIGGDLYAIVWDAKTQKLHGLNASGRSPLSLSYEMLAHELEKLGRTDLPPHGMLPISVPGAVDGWFELHKKQ